jgi:DNA-binding Lrp family transcriptional regulator
VSSLLPDPATLAEQLGHARGARDHLDRVVAWLEEGIDLLGAPAGEHGHELLPGPDVDDAAVPQRALEPPPKVSKDLQDLGDADPAVAPLQASAEASASPGPPASEAPESEPPTAPSPPARANDSLNPSSPPPATKPARTARPGARDLEAKVLSPIISSNQPLSKAQIAERSDLTVKQVTQPLQRLVAAGTVLASGATVSRRYRAAGHEPHSEARARTEAGTARNAKKMTDAVGRVGLRDRVMKAVSADPASLDNRRLAEALDADLEDIADACGVLVGKGRLQLNEDGTYLRSVAEAAREVAAA